MQVTLPAPLPKHLFYFALLRICVNKEQKQPPIILILLGGLIYSPLTRPVDNITDSYTHNLKGSGNLLYNRENK